MNITRRSLTFFMISTFLIGPVLAKGSNDHHKGRHGDHDEDHHMGHDDEHHKGRHGDHDEDHHRGHDDD